MKKQIFYIFFLGLLAFSCVPKEEVQLTEVNLDFADPVYKKIYGFQDSQQADSLYQYLRHVDPSYRFAVAQSFASYQNHDAVDSLILLLQDPIRDVVTESAYSLGQIGDQKAQEYLIKAFITKDTGTVNNLVNHNILEAMGKCGNPEWLPLISSASSYRKDDDLLILGQVRGIYRYGLRDIIAEEGTDRMMEVLRDSLYGDQARQVAANYFVRIKTVSLDSFAQEFVSLLKTDTNPYIRMCAAMSLSRVNDANLYTTLFDLFEQEKDYRVKAAILKALDHQPYIAVVEKVLALLKDKNLHIASAAADYLAANGNANDATLYLDYLPSSAHWLIRAKLLSGVLKKTPAAYSGTRKMIQQKLIAAYENAENPYAEAAYIRALASDPTNHLQIKNMGFTNANTVVRTSTMEALNDILNSENLKLDYRSAYQMNALKKSMAEYAKEAIESGDLGMVSIGADMLSNPAIEFDKHFENTAFIEIAQQELVLPRDIETYNSLKTLLNKVKGIEEPKDNVGFNHPIDWTLLSGITRTTEVSIVTNKGKIELRLFPEHAPGTVANFIDLINKDYYDGKYFHRVVSNFVIQGGCTRGDGYGSLDYTIRSELSPAYFDREGLVGMASAGNHTESTQFFITHVPTPHLDGKYTIFAEVVSGMDVVHNIYQGDMITDILIINP